MAIVTQTINVDLRPHYNRRNQSMVYCSQYDNDLRNIVLNIANEGVPVDVSTYTIYIEGTKPDKHGFSYELTSIGGSVSNNVITVPLQTQMTAAAGLTNAEVVLYSNDERIGSANFILNVEKAGLAEDVDISETDIPAYVDGAQQAAAEATQAKNDAVSAKDTAVSAAETAQDVLDSIPADYSDLSDTVDDLNNAISKSVSADLSTLVVGRANADGTFSPGLTNNRYSFRPCFGMESITYVARFWNQPGAVFYDANLNVVATEPSSTSTNPKTVTVPSNAYYYAINCTADMLDTMTITEKYYDVADALDNKLDSMIEYDVDVASIMVNHPVNNNGEIITGQTNVYHIWRNCENVDFLKVHTAYWSTPRVIFFDATGAVLSTVNWQSGENDYFVAIPNGAVEYAVNCVSSYVNIFAVKEYINTQAQIMRNDTNINSLQPVYADMVLPSFIPAVVGFPTYLYWENILTKGYLRQYMMNVANNVFGSLFDLRVETPTAAGNKTVTVEMYDKYKIVKSKSYTQKTVAANASGNVKCLIIGDSKSAATQPWVTLTEYLTADSNLNVTFLGTATSGPIHTEAYSGRSIVNVCDDEYITGTTPNIFYDASVTTTNGHHFSFAKAVQTLGATPDIVFIDHGANIYTTAWDTIKGCYDDVIASIHAVSSAIKIVVVIQEGQGLTRMVTDTGGKWWLENGSYASAQKLLAEYRDRDSEHIYIQPTYVFVDLYNDYPLCSLPTVEGMQGERLVCMDRVHPGLNTSQWNSSTSYAYGAWVAKNGKGYGCKVANSNHDPEADDGTYWSECKNLGDGYRKKGLMYYCMLKYLMTV